MEISNVDNSIVNRYTEIIANKKDEVKEQAIVKKQEDTSTIKDVEKSSLGSNIDILA